MAGDDSRVVVDADLGGHLQRCLALFQDIVSKVTISFHGHNSLRSQV